MSWKSKLWKITKTVGTAGLNIALGYLVDRYVAKKVPTVVTKMLHDAITGTAPPDFQHALETALEVKVNERIEKHPMLETARLSEAARAARERAGK